MKNSILIFRKQRIFQEFCTVFFSFTYFSWLVSELGKNLVHFCKHAFSSQHFYMYKELIKLNLDEIAFSTYLESYYCRYTWESHLFFSKILLPMELISISRNFVLFIFIKACYFRIFLSKNLDIRCQASEIIWSYQRT